MAEIRLRDQTLIGDYKKPYIIAELNSSHNGSIEAAKEMIMKAKECGCDCVKFQSWSAESLYSKSYYDANPITKRLVEKFSLSEAELLQLVDYCRNIDISFASTPYSKSEVDFLIDECHVPFIKIASMEINNYDFLKYIAEKMVPVILSTGMANIGEIRKAVNLFQQANNNQLILLHCVSIYPAEPSIIHLNNIIGLRNAFPGYPIGYSDHTLGIEIASAATALGACVIEKHFTLDNKKMGMDNNMATEPNDMKKLIENCENVHQAMGGFERVVSASENEQKIKMRRSIIAAKDLLKGATITFEDLDVKRPGSGLSAEMIGQLIGKTLNNDISKDTMILASDLLEVL